MKKIFFLLCFFPIVLLAAISNPSVQTPSEKSIVVQSTQPNFTIKLESCPSCGMSWLLSSYNASLITPVSHKIIRGTGGLLPKGAQPKPTYEAWTFHVNDAAFAVPQTTSVVFSYGHPWETQAVKKVTYTIVTG